MKGSTHALLGVTAAVAAHAYAPYLSAALPHLGIALFAAGIGALLPDLDADEGLLRQVTRTARSDGCLGRLVSWIMPAHRGVTHSGLAALAMILLARAWPHAWIIALAVGYVSHLLADMLTQGGVPVLWPLRWRLSLLPLTTGGLAERGIALAAGLGLWAFVLVKIGLWSMFLYAWEVIWQGL